MEVWITVKYLLLIILILLVSLTPILAVGDTISLGSVNTSPGQSSLIPITVNQDISYRGILLHLLYPEDIVSITDVTLENDQPRWIFDWFIPEPNKLRIIAIGPDPIPGNTVFNLHIRTKDNTITQSRDIKFDYIEFSPIVENQTFKDGILNIYNCGDLDYNGFIDIRDVVIILKIIIGEILPNETGVIIGDLDRNGNIGLSDAIRLLSHIVGLPVSMTDCVP